MQPTFRFCPECGRELGDDVEAPPHVYDSLTRLSQRIPTGLATKIRSTRDALAGERKQVTVLFCDLVGSTAIASGLDPEEYHDLLERYLELAFREVYRFEGIVNQLAGDGFMALFGAPVAHEDAPHRAIRAALAIRDALGSFRTGGGHQLLARIGIHTGPVVVGTVGNDLKMDYTAIGDTTNLASRLQALAAPSSILISDSTHRLVRGFFEVRPTGPLEVKGKNEPILAFEVLSRTEHATPIGVAAERGLTPLVGREGQLAALEAALERVGGRGQVVAVVGDAGSGKSRLVYEFKRRAEARGARILDGRCSALGQAIAYFPIITIFKGYFGLRSGDASDVVASKVAARLGAERDHIVREFPHLSRFVALPLGDGRGKAPPEELKRESFEAIAGLVRKESHAGPVVIVIEDLHWVDEPSRELVYALVPRLTGARVLLVVTHRPDERISWPSSVDLTEITLGRLSDGDVESLIRGVVGAPLPPELARLLVDKAAGSPFFAEEMTRGLVEDGFLVRDNGHSRLTRPVDEVPVPGSVHEVVAARLDRLPAEAKRVVQVASVIGRQFEVAQLQRLIDDPIDVPAALAVVEQRGLIHRKTAVDGDDYRFGESVTQEVAYESLLLKQRRQLHERIATLLDDGRAEASPEVRALLAHHYARSDNRMKAVAALLRAAEDAERLPSYRTAVDLYRQAWDCAETVLAERPDDPALRRAVLSAASGVCRLTVLFNLPHGEAAQRAAVRARELAEALGDNETLAGLGYFQGVMLMAGERDDFPRGLALVEEGIAVAERAGLRLTAARIGRGLCLQYAFDGRFDLARRALDWVSEEVERLNARTELPDLWVNMKGIRATILYLADELDGAAAAADETYRIALEIPNRTAQCMSTSALAQIHFLRGDSAAARRWADESLQMAETISNVSVLPTAAAIAVLTRLDLGERPAPERYLPPIEQGLTESGSPQLGVRFIVDALFALGDRRAAERYGAQLRAHPYGGRLREAHTAVTLGDLSARLGAIDEAERCYARAFAVADAIGARSTIVTATLGSAEAAAARNLPGPGARRLTHALALCRELRLERFRPRLERFVATYPDAVFA